MGLEHRDSLAQIDCKIPVNAFSISFLAGTGGCGWSGRQFRKIQGRVNRTVLPDRAVRSEIELQQCRHSKLRSWIGQGGNAGSVDHERLQ